MPIFTCLRCGKPFEGQAHRKRMYCAGACFRAREAEENRQRRTAWSSDRRCATSRVVSALRLGTLKRQPCETCGSRRSVVAHHDDYSKPLNVRWLCKSCHNRHHHTAGPGLNASAP